MCLKINISRDKKLESSRKKISKKYNLKNFQKIIRNDFRRLIILFHLSVQLISLNKTFLFIKRAIFYRVFIDI